MIFKYTDCWATAVVEEGNPIMAVLEDMAQAVGYMVPVITLEGSSDEEACEGGDRGAEGDLSIDETLKADAITEAFQTIKDATPQDFVLSAAAVVEFPGGDAKATIVVEAETEEEGEKIFDIIEKNAQALLESKTIGGPKFLDPRIAKEEREFYLSSYSKRNQENVLPEERPFPLAAEAVVDLSETLMGIGYLKWTWGNLSIRFGSDNMLITPSGRRYEELTGADIVKVNIESGEQEEGLMPSSEKDLHRLIYKSFPDARVIIHTHAASSSVFAAARKPIELGALTVPVEEVDVKPLESAGAIQHETDTASESAGSASSAVSAGTVFVADFAPAGTIELAENAVKALMKEGSAKAVLLANHGMVCFGENIDEAFDLCRFIEEEAERILNE